MVGMLIMMHVATGRHLRAPTGPVFGWLSMEGILVCGKGTAFTRVFHGNRLGHLVRSFGVKWGGDGMSEGRLNRVGKELISPSQVAQSVEAGCPA